MTGSKAGRQNAAERTMAANLGLALEDMALAAVILERAAARGIGTLLQM